MRIPRGLRRRLLILADWERSEYPTRQTVAEAVLLLCDEWCIATESARANILGHYRDHMQARKGRRK